MEGPFDLLLPADVAGLLGQRARELRLAEGLTQGTLAAMAGVSAITVRRFEATGAATLSTVLGVAAALGRLADLQEVFQPSPAASIDAVAEAAGARRRRGRR